jgi:DNA-directed RNA polymerase subunit omega
MKLKEGFDSNYRYVLVAARRARQLSSGAPPLVNTNTSKTCKIAQEEIEAGKIQYIKTSDAGSTAPAGNAEEKK